VNHGHQRRRRGASQRFMQYVQKIIAENFPNLEKVMSIELQEAFTTPQT
jgi:hypothetical protein